MERLDGKRIVVTGGTSGMGEGVVRAFPALGAKVVFWGRNETAGQKIQEETGAHFMKVNVSDEEQVRAAMKEANDFLGGIDVLIHAAGIGPHCPAESITFESFKQVFDINVNGTFLTNEAVFPYMKEKGGNNFMVNGNMVVQQYLVYTGNKKIKADNGRTYDCMVISIRDYKEGKERETVKAYVTNDSRHTPVQLDIILTTGVTIKALLK